MKKVKTDADVDYLVARITDQVFGGVVSEKSPAFVRILTTLLTSIDASERHTAATIVLNLTMYAKEFGESQ